MADTLDPNKPFIVDLVIVICRACGAERKYPINPPFRNAQAFLNWQTSGAVTACPVCWHNVVDMKLRLADEN